MHLTALRLVGFKSFVDPTEVPIAPGLTGLVGPNGCGKSNLVEAIRWAMGETSHKALRASAMEDVIFGGSAGRPARQWAEVMLRLDNRDRRAPPQLAQDDVIELSRRITRDGGSLYRVNGREVRARDVQVMFADAGSGARSPSLVRQGQVAELITAKPQARRRILEDAAGVAGLHARRHEAELRLRAASDNLQRLEDVLAEMQRQKEGLARQARQAERYRALSVTIARHEAAQQRHALRAAEARVAEARAARDRAVVEEAASRAGAESAARALAARDAEAAEAVARAEGMDVQVRRLQGERQVAQRERETAEARLREIALRLDELDGDRREAGATEADGARALASLEAELERLRQRAAAVAAERAALTPAWATAVQEQRATREHLLALETAQASAMAERAALVARREAAVARVRRAGEEARQAAEALAAGGDRPLPDREALVARLDAATAAVARAVTEAADAETALAAAAAADRAAQKAVAEARAALGRLEGEARALAALRRPSRGAAPPVLHDLKVAAGYERAVAAALGDDVDASLAVGAEAHWRALPASEHAPDPALPSGIVSLATFVTAPEALGRRLQQIGVVTAAEAVEVWPRLAAGQRLVTRDGDLWRWDGLSRSAGAPTAAVTLLEQMRRASEVAAALEATRQTAAAVEAEAAGASAALRAAETARAEARKRREALERARDEARQALALAERTLATEAGRRAALGERALRAQAEDELARAEHARTEEELAAWSGGPDAEAIGEARAAAEAAGQRSQDLERAAALFDREAAGLEERQALLLREREAWAERLQRAGARRDELARRERALLAERDTLEGRPAELRLRERSLEHEIGEARRQAAVAEDARAVAEAARAAAARARTEADRTLGEAREARARADALWEAATRRREEVQAAARDRWGDAAVECTQPEDEKGLPEGAELDATLQRLRQERDRLGPVNLVASEDLARVEAALAGLLAEKDDLEAAVRKLRAGIDALNSEGRARLMASFDAVNGHFRALFSTLFGGGEAELSLVESADPLEAGLEIMARPPGKKPQILSLLSGGEQALTAIALIFAVFLTNPSPLCVLDEIDAPLDDHNVERLCDLLDRMARETETRFLTITHNPITMARMDRLYGVTMTEPGVSRLVAVDLREAEALSEVG